MKKFIKNNFASKNNGESKTSIYQDHFEPQDFIDFSAIGIFKLNLDAVIEYANQTLAQILEFKSKSDLIGINFKNELISDSADWEKIKSRLYKHRIVKNFIIPLRQNGGGSIFVRVDIRAASDEKGNPIHFEGSVTDVSEFIQSQNRIKKELEALKEEKGIDAPLVTSSPSNSNEYLLSTVHKLKTPLNSIIGFLTLIEQGFLNSEEELKDFSHKARVSVNSLMANIDGIVGGFNSNQSKNSDIKDKSKVIAEDENYSNIVENKDEVKDESENEQPQEIEEKFVDQTSEDPKNISPAPSNGKSILLVEDNPISQNVEMRLLKESGYSVVAVTNGKDAIEAAKTNEFSLILMDVEMPNMDGIKATELIRKLDSPVKQVPIIAVTAHSSMKDREMCLASGMNDYIAKPININFMKMTIDQWLKRKIEI